MFNPLEMLRSIRDDQHLTANQVAILTMAVSRTDNKTSQVRCSQAQLATDAGVSMSTIKRFYSSEVFQEYFRPWKRGREVHLRWQQVSERHQIGVTVTPHLPISTSTNPSVDYEEKVLVEEVSERHLSQEEFLWLDEEETNRKIEELKKRLVN